MKKKVPEYKSDVIKITLLPYYLVGIIATTVGIIVVVILNLSTPLEFIQKRIFSGDQGVTWSIFISFFLPKFLSILGFSYLCVVFGINRLLKPIVDCLKLLKAGQLPLLEQTELARRRILNLSFLFFPVNIITWILIPGTIGFVGVLAGMTDHHTAIILSARASMVGLVSSAIASQRIEAISRKQLIPFFFPDGKLNHFEKVAKISLSKRITLANRLSALVPLLILLVTLLTLQWQLVIEPVSAIVYGRGVIIFTLVLFLYTIIFSKELNRLLSKSIVDPINKMVAVLGNVQNGRFDQQLQVVSNDEIGYAGDVVNEMTKGLKEREKLQKSLNLARQIQQNLLPKKSPQIPGLDIAGKSLYCDETGGDYYDYLLPEKKESRLIRVAMGDVSGHGISSALLMATSRALFRQRSALPGDLSQVVTDVNRLLCEDVADSGNFMTLFCVEIDPDDNAIKWVRAGHDPAVLYDFKNKTFKTLKGPGVAMGVDDAMIYSENRVSGLSKGHLLVLCTDGIWETKDATGRQFGKDNLNRIIEENSHLTCQDILEKIMEETTRFQKRAKRQDDATVIVIKFLNEPGNNISV